MKYTIRETNKGYVIDVRENRERYKFFLWDEQHIKHKYIPYILKYGSYTVGEPFNNIHPIYVKSDVFRKIDEDNSPAGIFIRKTKTDTIWLYYRSLISDKENPKLIKHYAKELKSNLSLLGVDALYEYIQAQAYGCSESRHCKILTQARISSS